MTFLNTKIQTPRKKQENLHYSFVHKKADILRYAIFMKFLRMAEGEGAFYMKKISHVVLYFYLEKNALCVTFLYAKSQTLCVTFLQAKNNALCITFLHLNFIIYY